MFKKYLKRRDSAGVYPLMTEVIKSFNSSFLIEPVGTFFFTTFLLHFWNAFNADRLKIMLHAGF